MKFLRVRLFGAFKQFAGESEIEISQHDITDLNSVKEKILKHLGESEKLRLLLNESVLGTDQGILQPDALMGDLSEISVLPPVCGG